jgi:hypothetical protein
MLKEKTHPPFTVSYYSAAEPRIPPAADILEDRWLHQVFLITHAPATWPAWKLAAGLLIAALLVWLVWWPLGSLAVAAATGGYLIFALTDWLLLRWLPKSGRSFGPIGPQLFVLTMPRIGAAIFVGLIGWALSMGLNLTDRGTVLLLGVLILLQLSGTAVYLWGTLREPFALAMSHLPIQSPRLPANAPPIRLLHLSDLHADISEGAMRRLNGILPGMTYDMCVLTGDYRGATFGPFDAALAGLALARTHLRGPIYGVLGNHDSILMVPELEDMGIRVLLNECEVISRGDEAIYLAGIDDAHYYRVDNIEKAASEIPRDGFSILLSHTPEVYRQAAHAGFDVFLSGHTHGGQICLPGSIPITLGSVLPRHMGSGSWQYGDMIGYTSVGVGCAAVSVRFNCLPEITLHHLKRI